MDRPPPLRLQVAAQAAAIEPARLAMRAHLAGLDLPDRVVYRLELVLEESLMNRVWHAWPAGGAHAVTLEVDHDDTDVVLRLEDDGVAFDPTTAADPVPAEDLAHARSGGRGLMLMRRAVRSIAYRRDGGRNIVTLRVARTDA